MSVSFKAVIPARYASSRLPGKPLLDIHGKPMVVRVAQRAIASGAEEVVVATDHEAIYEAAKAEGLDVLMTQADWPSGTDRLAEVVRLKGWANDTLVVNVQGDEPLIDPNLIRDMALWLDERTEASIATCAHTLDCWEDFCNPNIVKIALGAGQKALYFSRAPIPYPRDHLSLGSDWPKGPLPDKFKAYRHIGLYAYRAGFLSQYATWPESTLDHFECLEQLRALWNGHTIVVKVIDHMPAPGVDTSADLEKVRKLWEGP